MYFKDVLYARNCLVSALAKPKQHVYTRVTLTHLSRMEFPTDINWNSPFPVLGLLGGIFHFIQNLKETSVSKQWRT